MEVFERRFYLRPAKIWDLVKKMLTRPQMMKRRLREGLKFLRARNSRSATLTSNRKSTT